MNYLLPFAVLLTLSQGEVVGESKSKYNDIRCLCQCKEFSRGQINIPLKVYTTNLTKESCLCEIQLHHVNFAHKSIMDQYCLGCDCSYEVRSIRTMEVVVLIYITIILLLFAYMLFMWIAEIVNRSRKTSTQAETLQLMSEQPSTSANANDEFGMRNRHSSSGSIGHRLTTAQSQWKRQVKSQRDKVFSSRDILQ